MNYKNILFFILGSSFGSFLYCLATRSVKNISITKGRSKCDYCEKELSLKDLIPIISYIITLGRCRYCKAKLSFTYPLVEMFSGLIFLLIFNKYDFSLKTLSYLILYACLFVISIIDLKTYEIPDRYLLISIVSWVVLSIFEGNFYDGIIGGLIVAAIVLLLSKLMKKLTKKESLGGGDVKLLFVTGLYLGLIGNLINLLLACVLGLIFSLINKKQMIPFAPAISLACMFMLLFGSKLVELYVSL